MRFLIGFTVAFGGMVLSDLLCGHLPWEAKLILSVSGGLSALIQNGKY